MPPSLQSKEAPSLDLCFEFLHQALGDVLGSTSSAYLRFLNPEIDPIELHFSMAPLEFSTTFAPDARSLRPRHTNFTVTGKTFPACPICGKTSPQAIVGCFSTFRREAGRAVPLSVGLGRRSVRRSSR